MASIYNRGSSIYGGGGIYGNAQAPSSGNITDLQELLDQIMGKAQRLDQAGMSDLVKTTQPPKVGRLQKLGNILSTGQKVSAKTLNDLLTEGKLPTMSEYGNMANPETSFSYSDVLKNVGMKEGLGKKALGLGMDIVLDPINLIPFSMLGKGIGKMVKPVAKLAEKLPLIGGTAAKINEGVGKIGTKFNQWRNITPEVSEGLNNVHTIMMGATSRTGDTIENIQKKYADVFSGVLKLDPERYKVINKAIELPKLRGTLDKTEKAWVDKYRTFLKDTGLQKKEMGVIPDLWQGMLKKEGAVTDTSRGMQQSLPGLASSEELANNMAEQMVYNAHIMTPEARAYFREMSGSPEEMKNIMAGMIRKGIPTTEKSRSMVDTINNLNDYWMNKHKIKLFEDDPTKILKEYTTAFSKRKALWDMQQEIMKVTDDAGNPLIKMAGDKPTDGMVKLTGIPYKGDYETTPEVAKMLNRVNGVFASDETTNKFLKFYDSALKKFKYSVTMPWPTFNLNNLMGATFNNFIYDAGTLKEFPEALAITLGKPSIIHGPGAATMTAKEFKNALSKYGALNTFANIEAGAKDLNAFDKLGKSLSKSKLIKGYATNLPNNIESLVRTQLALSVYKKTGSMMKAARAVWEVHGNYTPEFLSGFEKNIMTRVMPFWRWMRTSIPFQFEQMYKKTGKYAAMAKTENAIISPEERQKLPSYLQDQPILSKTGDGDKQSIVTANLPFLDVTQLSPENVASRMTPFAKVPMEVLFNRQLFSKQPIVDEDLPAERQNVKADSWMGKIPILKQLLGIKETEKMNKQTGEWEPRTEANAMALYLLQNAGPLASLSSVGKKTARIAESQGVENASSPEALMSLLQGILDPRKTYNYSPSDQTYQDALAQNAKLQAIISDLLQHNELEKKTTKKKSSIYN